MRGWGREENTLQNAQALTLAPLGRMIALMASSSGILCTAI